MKFVYDRVRDLGMLVAYHTEPEGCGRPSRAGGQAVSMKFVYDRARDLGMLVAYHTEPEGCGRPSRAGGQVGVLWLGASHERVVVIREGSFPPWVAAAAARRLVLELWSFVR
eukprot:scaffold28081_cov65-Attheya_sp.AAC.2